MSNRLSLTHVTAVLRGIVLVSSVSVICTFCSCSYRIARVQYDTQLPPPNPLGYAVDPFVQIQETNGEASDFVIYEHEFVGDTVRLNTAGEDHLKQIAMRVAGTPFPVVVERSMSSARPGDKYKYPVHANAALDDARRALVVELLLAMGVADAEQRTVVAPAIAEGIDSAEAERAYYDDLSGTSSGSMGNLRGARSVGGF